MANHFQGLLVTFEEPVRDEDMERIADAIRLLPKVVKVEPAGEAQNFDHHMIRTQEQMKLREKLWAIMDELK